MRNSEKALAALTGEVHALFMITQALAMTHSNPQVVLAELDKIELIGPAQLQANPVPDAAVDAYDDTIRAIRQSLLANPLYNQGH